MAAATVVLPAWAALGLVNPGMVNVIAAPPVNVPVDIVTVKTCPARAAAPAGLPVLGAVKTTGTLPVRAKPFPAIVMTILPVEGTVTSGVRETVIVTAVAPLPWLLRVMAGDAAPRLPKMAG